MPDSLVATLTSAPEKLFGGLPGSRAEAMLAAIVAAHAAGVVPMRPKPELGPDDGCESCGHLDDLAVLPDARVLCMRCLDSESIEAAERECRAAMTRTERIRERRRERRYLVRASRGTT